MAENKQKNIDLLLTDLEKQYGIGAIMRLGQKTNFNVEAISSGSISLDVALGIGGFPKGRVVEIFGAESSGKTTLALHAIASVQKKGGEAAFIDAEHAFDPVYAKALGVNIDNLLISQPETGEQGLKIVEALIRSGSIDIIVIDSVAALVPKAEIDGEMGDAFIGLHARLMSQALRKLSGILSKSHCIAIFINQLREKVGIIFGNPEVTTGGRALKFYSSIRLDIRRIENIKNGTEIIGNRTRVKVVKNKMAPPFQIAEFDIIYGEGISKVGEIIDFGIKYDIIKKNGSWFSLNDLKLGQGKDSVKQILKNDKKLFDDLEKQILKKIKNSSTK